MARDEQTNEANWSDITFMIEFIPAGKVMLHVISSVNQQNKKQRVCYGVITLIEIREPGDAGWGGK